LQAAGFAPIIPPMSLTPLGAGPALDYSDPVAVLKAAHRRIEAHLSTLARIVEALREPGQPRLREAQAALAVPLTFFATEGVRHALDEDASVFPRLAHPGLAELTAGHREHEAMFLAVRSVAQRLQAGEADAALVDDLELHVGAFSAAQREHMRLEEAEVFPLIAALEPREVRAIGLEMRVRRG
jgi:hemerythrin-like domain-containing protein